MVERKTGDQKRWKERKDSVVLRGPLFLQGRQNDSITHILWHIFHLNHLVLLTAG